MKKSNFGNAQDLSTHVKDASTKHAHTNMFMYALRRIRHEGIVLEPNKP